MAQQKVIVRKRNSNAEAGYDKEAVDQAHEKALRKLETKRLLKSRADLLARDFQYIRNYPVGSLKELYPDAPWMWKVDKCYLNAEGGKLLIDEPSTFEMFDRLQMKIKFLNENGHRYVLLKPNGNSFEDEQELSKCGQQQQMA